LPTNEEIIKKIEQANVPNYKYVYKFTSTDVAYFHEKGISVIQYFYKDGVVGFKRLEHAYSWRNFKIDHYYYSQKTEKIHDKKFSFVLNDEPYGDYTWDEMIKKIKSKTNVLKKYVNLITKFIDMYVQNEYIEEYKVADVLGFVDGWQMPDSCYFVAGNDFRRDVEKRLLKLCDLANSKDFDDEKAKNYFRRLYFLTGIDYKDYIFAYHCVAPFLFALRKKTKMMPFLALGGVGYTGKTSIEEFGTIKMWGNTHEMIGSDIMDKLPRVQGMFTASTFPVSIDDCSDLKPFLISLFKRYTTTPVRVKKLRPDLSLKMDSEYCTPVEMTFNDPPVLFDDPQFRQRTLVLEIGYGESDNQEWIDLFNEIPPQYIGAYIYRKTRNMSYDDLIEIFDKQDGLGIKGRGEFIAKILGVGVYFAKDWFDIDLNIAELPIKIIETLKVGNEMIVDLIKEQIRQGTEFKLTKDGVFENPNKKSWVINRVLRHKYKKKKWDETKYGYLYSTENCLDLAKRMGRKPRDLSINTLGLMLKSEWNVEIGVFYIKKNKVNKTIRGIFIPDDEISGDRLKREMDYDGIPKDTEIDENIEDEFVPVDIMEVEELPSSIKEMLE